MVAGLSRTIRSETLLPFATLDLDDRSRLTVDETVDVITKVFYKVFSSPSSNGEMEFMERSDSLLTARIVHDDDLNVVVHQETRPNVLQQIPFGRSNRSLKLAIGDTGFLDTLHFIDDLNGESPLGPDDVVIQIHATGVNHRDYLVAQGKLSSTEMGIEASGIVVSVGYGVKNLEVGHRVAAIITQGAFSTHARTKAALAFQLPEQMSFESAATLPLAYATAYYSLIELGCLRHNESILVHAGAGSVGQAAINLATMIGAEVFTTVGTSEKKEFLMKEYGLLETNIFYSRSGSFVDTIRQRTNGVGVDLVLNCWGSVSRESWKCLDRFGRLVDVSSRDAALNTCLEMQAGHNTSFHSVDILSLADKQPELMKRLLLDVSNLMRYGKIKPVSPITMFQTSDVELAFKTLHSGKAHGKLVVVSHAYDIVKATPPKNPIQILKDNATYILIGGTGGLGRSIARWMVERGARHLVLVSRNGSATGKVKDLIQEAAAVGAEVILRQCDVADPADVEDFDVLFEKMTYEDYMTVISSKVQGGWNFHRALINTPLDFFVAVSSVAGEVGNRGQAAYAAANCFLDALVQHRLAMGLPASSLDLTAISDSGYLAEDLEKAAEVTALLGAAISGRLAATCNSHTITGMRITPTIQPFWTQDAKCKYLREAAEALVAADTSTATKVISYNAAIKAAKTLEEAEQVVCDGLVSIFAAAMMMELEDLDITRSLSHYPLDSLVAIEIRNFITREFEATLQVLELLSSGSIQTLSKVKCAKSKLVNFQ
ncbi:putative PKS-like enzyme [Xylariaceae sp. FL0255]|nr:putative PKS-like enzyme [Xylariaceae sp. FL0255]